MELHALTLHEAQQRLAAGDLTAVRLTEAVLERIDSVEPTVRAYLSLDREGAIAQAEAAEHTSPGWIEVIPGQLRVLVHTLPTREQIDTLVSEQLIVELYSK